MRLTNQHGPAAAGFDETDPAQDQGADDTFTEVGLGDDQRAQLSRHHQKRLGAFFSVPVHEGVAPGEGRNFGDKLTRTPTRDGHDMA